MWALRVPLTPLRSIAPCACHQAMTYSINTFETFQGLHATGHAASLHKRVVMAGPFVVRQHVFEGQHVREYPRALAVQEDSVRLQAKSYTPKEIDDSEVTGNLTVIAFHANAFPKEVYEPFFEALYRRLKDGHGIVVSSIWIADQASQGFSAILNDEKLGNDPHWFDHARDILAMVNAFRQQMKRPIVGIGHSLGGTQALATAHYHPRLFEAIAMIDPPISLTYAPTMQPMLSFALSRPETYDSWDQVEKTVRKTPLFKTWDRRALQRYIDTAFHTSPTATQPNTRIKPKTTKYVEATTLVRPNTEHLGVSKVSDVQRAIYPNVDPDAPLTGPVYNAPTRIAWSFLPTLRPAALFLLGKGSRLSDPDELEERSNITGVAPGGNGGHAAGKVATVSIPGGHFLPMTNPDGSAAAIAEWLREELHSFRKREDALMKEWDSTTLAEKQKLSTGVEDVLRSWDGKPWAKPKANGKKSRL